MVSREQLQILMRDGGSAADHLATLLESSVASLDDTRRLHEENEETSKRIEKTEENVRQVYERLFDDGERQRERRRVYSEIGVMAEGEMLRKHCSFQPRLVARGRAPHRDTRPERTTRPSTRTSKRSDLPPKLVVYNRGEEPSPQDDPRAIRGGPQGTSPEVSARSVSKYSEMRGPAFSRLHREASARKEKLESMIREQEEKVKPDFHPKILHSQQADLSPRKRTHSKDLFLRLYSYADRYKRSKEKLAQSEFAKCSFRPDVKDSARTGPQFEKWTPIWERFEDPLSSRGVSKDTPEDSTGEEQSGSSSSEQRMYQSVHDDMAALRETSERIDIEDEEEEEAVSGGSAVGRDSATTNNYVDAVDGRGSMVSALGDTAAEQASQRAQILHKNGANSGSRQMIRALNSVSRTPPGSRPTSRRGSADAKAEVTVVSRANQHHVPAQVVPRLPAVATLDSPTPNAALRPSARGARPPPGRSPAESHRSFSARGLPNSARGPPGVPHSARGATPASARGTPGRSAGLRRASPDPVVVPQSARGLEKNQKNGSSSTASIMNPATTGGGKNLQQQRATSNTPLMMMSPGSKKLYASVKSRLYEPRQPHSARGSAPQSSNVSTSATSSARASKQKPPTAPGTLITMSGRQRAEGNCAVLDSPLKLSPRMHSSTRSKQQNSPTPGAATARALQPQQKNVVASGGPGRPTPAIPGGGGVVQQQQQQQQERTSNRAGRFKIPSSATGAPATEERPAGSPDSDVVAIPPASPEESVGSPVSAALRASRKYIQVSGSDPQQPHGSSIPPPRHLQPAVVQPVVNGALKQGTGGTNSFQPAPRVTFENPPSLGNSGQHGQGVVMGSPGSSVAIPSKTTTSKSSVASSTLTVLNAEQGESATYQLAGDPKSSPVFASPMQGAPSPAYMSKTSSASRLSVQQPVVSSFFGTPTTTTAPGVSNGTMSDSPGAPRFGLPSPILSPMLTSLDGLPGIPKRPSLAAAQAKIQRISAAARSSLLSSGTARTPASPRNSV
ncbi:unnamed protein product [Amoebophrya sp. A25]|nr:unnamed protein product [Amoebophrya sp. A25]|eukprot:GSA25T00023121001.1